MNRLSVAQQGVRSARLSIATQGLRSTVQQLIQIAWRHIRMRRRSL